MKKSILPAAAGLCALLLAGTPSEVQAVDAVRAAAKAAFEKSPAQGLVNNALGAIQQAVGVGGGALSTAGSVASAAAIPGEQQLSGYCYDGACIGTMMAKNSTLVAFASTNNSLLRKITELVIQWSKEQIAVGVAFEDFATQMRNVIELGSTQIVNALREGSKVLAASITAADYDPLSQDDPCRNLAANSAAIYGDRMRRQVAAQYVKNMEALGDGVYATASEAENVQHHVLLEKIDQKSFDASLFFGADSTGTGAGQYAKPIGGDKAPTAAVAMAVMTCPRPVGKVSDAALETYNGRMALKGIQTKAAYVRIAREAMGYVASLNTAISAYYTPVQSLEKDTGMDGSADMKVSYAQSVDGGSRGQSAMQFYDVYVANATGANNKIRAAQGTQGTVNVQMANLESLRMRIAAMRSETGRYRAAILAALAGLEVGQAALKESKAAGLHSNKDAEN